MTKEKLAPPVAEVVPPEEYNAVVANALLANSILTTMSFDVRPDFVPNTAALSFQDEPCGFHFSSQTGTAVVMFEWTVIGKNEGQDRLTVKATYSVIYQGLGGMTERAVAMFVERFGRYVSYPYFRGLVASLFAQADLSIPPLPILRDGGVGFAVPGARPVANLVAPQTQARRAKPRTKLRA